MTVYPPAYMTHTHPCSYMHTYKQTQTHRHTSTHTHRPSCTHKHTTHALTYTPHTYVSACVSLIVMNPLQTLYLIVGFAIAGLTHIPSATATSSCAVACCNDAECETWQFCPSGAMCDANQVSTIKIPPT